MVYFPWLCLITGENQHTLYELIIFWAFAGVWRTLTAPKDEGYRNEINPGEEIIFEAHAWELGIDLRHRKKDTRKRNAYIGMAQARMMYVRTCTYGTSGCTALHCIPLHHNTCTMQYNAIRYIPMQYNYNTFHYKPFCYNTVPYKYNHSTWRCITIHFTHNTVQYNQLQFHDKG